MKPTDYTKIAKEYDSRGIIKKEWKFGYSHLLQIMGDLKGKRILDYGCGAGKFSRVLAKEEGLVIGVDKNQTMIDLAREKDIHNITYHLIKNNDIDFLDTFDFAVLSFVVCSLHEDNNAKNILETIYTKLDRKGSLLILEPHPETRLSKNEIIKVQLEGMTLPIYDRVRTISQYKNLIEDSGFTIESMLETKDEYKKPQMLIFQANKKY